MREKLYRYCVFCNIKLRKFHFTFAPKIAIIKQNDKREVIIMFEYEKSFTRLALVLTFGLAWLTVKTLFYTLPKALARLIAKHN